MRITLIITLLITIISTKVTQVRSQATCQPGSEPDPNNPSQCRACEPGKYNAEYDTSQCSDITICVLGEGATTIGTPTRNSECDLCPQGFYSDVADYESACQTVSSCVASEIEISPPTTQSDRVCKKPGCMVPEAINYDATATIEDNSCTTCSTCNEETAQDIAGQTTCVQCKEGLFRQNAEDCATCAATEYNDQADNDCETLPVCANGEYRIAAAKGAETQDCGTTHLVDATLASLIGCIDRCESHSTCTKIAYDHTSGICYDDLSTGGTTTCTLYTIAAAGCEKCPLGTHGDGSQVTCTDCADALHTTSAVGSTDSSACAACPAGEILSQHLYGRICTECPSGKYQTGNTCVECAVGEGSAPGATSCAACAAGTYEDGTRTCVPCAAGTASSGTGNTVCAACLAGKYQDQTQQTSCIDCAAGEYQTSTGQTSCDTCLAGTHSSNGAGNTGSTGCTACLDGYISADNADQCTECAAGTYDLNNVCVACNAGEISSAHQTSCSACAAGTKEDGTRTACTNCALAKYQDQTGQTTCKDCETCTAGYYRPTCAGDNGGACVACLAGTVKATAGFWDSVCTNCPSATYSAAGASSCTNCAVGQFQPNPGQETCQACQTCVAGKERENCAAAVEGTCEDCGIGHAKATQGAWNTMCDACGIGKYQNQVGQTTCKDCATGHGQPATGQGSCIMCGKGLKADSGVCTQCGHGEYQDEVAQTTCKLCPNNLYHTLMGEMDDSNCAATNCPIGKYGAATQCLNCAAGTYSDTLGPPVHPAGHPQEGQPTGETECKACVAGRTSLEGSNDNGDCTECSAGTKEVNNLCVDCDQGKYQNVPGQTTCTACVAGKTTALPASGDITDCFDCPIAKKEVGNICIDCPLGQYNDVTAATTCKTLIMTDADKYKDATIYFTGQTTEIRTHANADCEFDAVTQNLRHIIRTGSKFRMCKLPGTNKRVLLGKLHNKPMKQHRHTLTVAIDDDEIDGVTIDKRKYTFDGTKKPTKLDVECEIVPCTWTWKKGGDPQAIQTVCSVANTPCRLGLPDNRRLQEGRRLTSHDDDVDEAEYDCDCPMPRPDIAGDGPLYSDANDNSCEVWSDTHDDCVITGCMDATANNFNTNALVDDGLCKIHGCTNSDAENYNPLATFDNGFCYFVGCAAQKNQIILGNYDDVC